jgi:hypothetical protein
LIGGKFFGMNSDQIELQELDNAELISGFAKVCVYAQQPNPADWDAAIIALLARAIERATGREVNIQGMFK